MHGVRRTLILHRNVKQCPEACQVDDLLLLRIDMRLCLAQDVPVKDMLATSKEP